MTTKTVATDLGPLTYEDEGVPDGPAAILWPSLFSDHSMWDRQVEALRGARWRTLALDPPGHGLSPGPGRIFTMDECADAGVRLLETLPQGVPVVIMGTSWGGMIAPRIAALRPDRVKGLVLFNTTADAPNLQTRLTARLLTIMLALPPLDRLVNKMLLSMQLSAETRGSRPEVGQTLAAQFRSWDRRALIRSVDSVLVRRDAFFDKLGSVSTPALVVSGKEDTILPTPLSRRITGRMPHARHVEVAGAAHLVPLEQPVETNRLMLDYLRTVVSTEAATSGSR